MRWLLLISVAAVVLLVPSEAWAWGPFTHLLCARGAIEAAGMLPAPIAELMSLYATDFYYGNLAADIVVAKTLADERRHAHTWKNAFPLLRASETPEQRAFSLGYLSHLASDMVAHSYFIPLKMVQTFPSKFLNHTFWEARFDKRSYPHVADLAASFTTTLGEFRENDLLQKKHISGTVFSFGMNKRIFDGVYLVQTLSRWQRIVQAAENRSSWPITDEEWQECIDMGVAQIRGLLWRLEDSPVLRGNPRGTEALAMARQVRRELKRLLRRGAIRPDHAGAVGEYFRPILRATLEGEVDYPGMTPLLTMLRERDDAALAAGVALPAPRRPVLQRMAEAAAEKESRRAKRRKPPAKERKFPPETRIDGARDGE